MSKQIIDFAEIWKKSKLLVTDKIEAPPICFSCEIENGRSEIGTLGNFSMITGRKKSRKTFFVSVLAAIALNNGEHLGIKASFPEGQNRVLYFDTEQSKHHAKKVLDRILKINGMGIDIHPENLEYILLRQYAPQIRLEVMDYIIEHSKNVGLIVIDGIKDIVTSINDESEATKTATKLLEWSAKYNVHIITVLHQNKNDENSRGHLGTELDNKAESIINVSKSLDQPENSKVESKAMRDKDFETFAFGIDENNVPVPSEISSEGITKQKPKVEELTESQRGQLLYEAFNKKSSQGWKELQYSLRDASVKLNIFINLNKCTELITYFTKENKIKVIDKKYINVSDEIPF